MHEVTLVNGKKYDAAPDSTILESAISQRIVLEYSCRNGRCEACKAKLVSGTTEPIKPELSLSPQEVEEGYILTCCRAPKSDVMLDIEDLSELEDIEIKTLPCRIDSLEKVSNDVMRVVLRTPPMSRLHFLPGQYIDIIGHGGVRRSYSIANAPRNDGRIELQIKRVKNGQLSDYWFNTAEPNDLLRLEGPLGTFYLRDTQAKNVIFLATGTGAAPVQSILEALASQPDKVAGRRIFFLWGGRSPDDLYWKPDFPTLDITYVPTLSRVKEGWTGRHGYVQQVLIAEEVPLKDSVVYACGSDAMIHSAREALVSAGLSPKHFYSDAFVSSS